MSGTHEHLEPGVEPSSPPAQTDVEAYGPVSARDLIAELDDLLAIAGHEDPDLSERRLEELGLDPEADDPPEEQADQLLDELPLGVEATVTFEIVLGTGGPDRRLCLECDVGLLEASEFGRFPDAEGFTVRRVHYRYSWSGTAEVELTGAERKVAEEFAARVVPELGR